MEYSMSGKHAEKPCLLDFVNIIKAYEVLDTPVREPRNHRKARVLETCEYLDTGSDARCADE